MWKQPRRPRTGDWLEKTCLHTTELQSAVRRNETLRFATCMGLEGIILSEVGRTEKHKYSVITSMWNLKNKTNEQM